MIFDERDTFVDDFSSILKVEMNQFYWSGVGKSFFKWAMNFDL